MPDQVLTRDGPVSVPMDYVVPQGGELIPLMVRASMNGAAAASAFYAAVQVIAPSGRVMGTAITSSIAAGASADVTWFPRVGGGSTFTPTPGTGVPPEGNLDGYIFNTSNQTITALGHADRTNLLIQGNAISLDGVTSIRVEYWCTVASILNGVANQGIGIELWDNFSAADVDKGTIGLLEVTTANTGGTGLYATVSLTPAAGTHTYAIYGWKAVNASTAVISANSFIDGTGNIAPMWYRITVISYDASLPS
jgi:hypothetical protein